MFVMGPKLLAIALLAGPVLSASSWVHAAALQSARASVLSGTFPDDSKHIEVVLKRQFDRLNEPLMIKPVTVVGNYALAG